MVSATWPGRTRRSRSSRTSGSAVSVSIRRDVAEQVTEADAGAAVGADRQRPGGDVLARFAVHGDLDRAEHPHVGVQHALRTHAPCPEHRSARTGR